MGELWLWVVGILAAIAGVMAFLLARRGKKSRREDWGPKDPPVASPKPVVLAAVENIEETFEKETEKIEDALDSDTPATDVADIVNNR